MFKSVDEIFLLTIRRSSGGNLVSSTGKSIAPYDVGRYQGTSGYGDAIQRYRIDALVPYDSDLMLGTPCSVGSPCVWK